MQEGTLGELKAQITIETSGVKTGASESIDAIGKVKMNAQELEAELKALATDYGTLRGKMEALKQAGLQNTKEFKDLENAATGVKLRFDELGKEYENVGNKTQIFRQKRLDAARDFTIIAYGIRQAGMDFKDLSNEMQKNDADWEKLGSSAGAAGLSLLTIVPSLQALKTALPAPFVAALAPIAAVAAALAGMYVFVTKFKDQLPALDRAFRFLFSDLTFDAAVKEFEALNSSMEENILTAYSLGDAMKWLQTTINGAVDTNRKKFIESTAGFNDTYQKMLKGETVATDQLNASLKQLKDSRDKTTDKKYLEESGKVVEQIEKQIKAQNDLGRTIEKPTGRGSRGPVGRDEKEQKADLDFVEALRAKIVELQNELVKLGELAGDPNTKANERILLYEQQIKLQRELNDLMGIGNLNPMSIESNPIEEGVIRKRTIGENPRAKEEEEKTRLMNEQLGFAQGMWSNFQGMLNATGLMKGSFGEFVSMLSQLINGVSSGVGFFKSIIGFVSSFIPGGGLIASAASSGGGAGGSVHGNNGYGSMMANIVEQSAMVPAYKSVANTQSGASPSGPDVFNIKVESEIGKGASYEVFKNGEVIARKKRPVITG